MINNYAIRNNDNVTKLVNTLKQCAEQYTPLSKAEEQDLIKKYAGTDPDKLKQLLMLHNIKMVFSIAKKYTAKSKDFDEMVARGMLGLAVAADKFDYTRNVKFSTHAYMWIFKYVQQEFSPGTLEKESKTVSLDFTINNAKDGPDTDDSKNTFENIVSSIVSPTVKTVKDVHEELSSHDCQTAVENVYAYLKDDQFSDLDRTIFERVVDEGQSVRLVSADLNLTPQYVHKRKTEILKSIRDMLAKTMAITSIADV